MGTSTSASISETVTSRLVERLGREPARPALRLYRQSGPGDWLSFETVLGRAAQYGSLLIERGAAPGQVVVLILDDPEETVYAFVGAMLAGAVPSVFAHPSVKIEAASYRETLSRLLAACRTRFVVTNLDVVDDLDAVDGITVMHGRERLDRSTDCSPHRPAPGDTALLQHSSGTTGLKKGVALTHGAVLAQLDAYSAAIEITAGDRIASWLPLYHDMGLIACFLLPLAVGVPLALMSPFAWLARPTMLLEAIAKDRCTLCWLPNFAYSFLAQRVGRDERRRLDLSSMRAFINCSEPISARSHDTFLSAFGGAGVTPDQLATCYAMAETTFAVTQSAVGETARRLTVDWEVFAREHHVVAARPATPMPRTLVSSGRPIPGAEVRILDDHRTPLPDGAVGEIAIAGPSLMTGYFNAPEATAGVLVDGLYLSGDLGFVDGGDLYVTGRRKDLIIIAGNNVYPQDVEEVVSEVGGVYPGRVVCCGVWDEAAGTEQLVVMAETLVDDPRDRTRLKLAIARAVRARLDCTADDVVLLPHMSLVKSSSGKISRAANRDRYVEGRLGDSAAVASRG